MELATINPSKIVVLTGAGFSKNFGGFLAREMWFKIFNDPRLHTLERVRKMLTDNMDYEAVIAAIEESDADDSERATFSAVVNDVYAALDRATAGYIEHDEQARGVSMYGLNDFFMKLRGLENNKVHFIFTTNQDFFFERQNNMLSHFVGPVGNWQLRGAMRLERSHYVTLPTESELAQKIERYNNPTSTTQYIKLHGSIGWLSASTGENGMVIGKNKPERIRQEPVLALYNDMFRTVLSQPGCRLVVIGYGFNDDHINEAIVAGMKSGDDGLRMYVISTADAEKMMNRFHSIDPIMPTRLRGYWPEPLSSIFPYGRSGDSRERTRELLDALRA